VEDVPTLGPGQAASLLAELALADFVGTDKGRTD
jgi:hypothetical protein